MATVYKIHPAIGIARVGNSPNEFFIGPERIGERPNPQGGFKDAQCRVKRQVARFRIFAHHDDASVEEITGANADITWTVHLANKKAANPARGNSESPSDLIIDPGPRTLNGPDQHQLFDTGTIKFAGGSATKVPLGEIRTDNNNRLLVFGGAGKSGSPTNNGLGDFWKNTGWYDDVSDGPVTATIKLHADNSTPAVLGAWVIATPPKFAPHQDSVITLYDRVLEVMIEAGFVAKPVATSYTADIYPILQRARDIRWVITIPAGAMTWPDPVTSDALRLAIFNSLKKPGGGGDDMPQINPPDTGDPTTFQTDRLTQTQYDHMERWKDNNYANDWAGPPAPQAAITPDGLDRAALEACVGGSFYPGIEAGGLPPSASARYPGLPAEPRPIVAASNYAEAFRLDQNIFSPGDITAAMALPWQADFTDCDQNWWPVPRPNEVIRQGMGDQNWIAGIVGSLQDMVDKWNQLGFVVRQGNQNVESQRCNTTSITLLTPLLNFQDVPQGPMGMVREVPLAITFEVISTANAVTLEYTPGDGPMPPQLAAFNGSVIVGPTAPNTIVTARLWVIYRTSNVGDTLPPQQVTVQTHDGSQQWVVTIIGNTVARKTAAVALTLDRSGSMSEDRGDGQSKHASLQLAASNFVDAMLEGDGVGIVSFNQTAQKLQTVLQLGDGMLSDTNRQATKDVINGNGLDPQGSTSIGNGIFDAREILDSTSTPFDVKALVVLTDGMENTPRFIADVAPQIDAQTYAIGLGMPQNISVPALQTISGNNGGYLLLTGAIVGDNRFLLQKYFLQILAGVSNADIVLDPDGQLIPGRVERVPFQLISGDAGVDVILLTPYTNIVDFRLQTPGGRIIEPWQARSDPGMRYIQSAGVSYYRLALPVQLVPNRPDQEGTWYALLTIGKPRLEPTTGSRQGVDVSILRGIAAPISRQRPSGTLQAETRRAQSRAANLMMTAAVASGGAGAASFVASSQRMLPYSLVVHAYSNISLQARTGQSSFDPGASIDLYATLTQSGIPAAPQAAVWAEVTRPDGIQTTLSMLPYDVGQFSAKFVTAAAGIYRLRVRARGMTQRGEPFTRERTLTCGVWVGGDRDAGSGPGDRGGNEHLCEVIKCLTRPDGVISRGLEERLLALGINLAQARKCLSLLCSDKPIDPNALR